MNKIKFKETEKKVINSFWRSEHAGDGEKGDGTISGIFIHFP